MATRKKPTRPISSFDDLDAAGIGAGYRPTLYGEPLASSSETPVVPERSTARAIGDLATQFAGGAVSGVRMMSDVFGADNAVSGGLRSAEEALRAMQSAAAKADQQEVGRIMQEAEGKGWGEQIASGLKAFGVAPGAMMAQALGTSIPTLATGLIPGAGPAAVVARIGAAGAAGAAQGAGNIKGIIYEEVKNKPLPGEAPEQTEARAIRAQEYGGENSGQIALGGGLGFVAGSTGMERVAAGLRNGVTQAAPGMIARVGTGAVTEMVPELAQGVQEKYAGNTALVNEGFDVDPWSGAVASGVMGAAAGGVMGGAFGVPNPSVRAEQTPGDTIRQTETVPESGPMTRAANTATEQKAQAADAEALRLGFNPLAGTPVVFPDGSVALGSEQEQAKRAEVAGQEAQANQAANIEQFAARRPPVVASDAARILEEAKGRGLDFAAAPHPQGGFMVVPSNWVTPQVAQQAQAELNDTLSRMQAVDSQPVQRAPRTGSATAQELNLNTDPVKGYVDSLRQVNTPAAKLFVRDFDAGAITPQDVQARMDAERTKTPDERLAAAAAEGLRMNPKGDPFKTLFAAQRATRQTPGDVIEVQGGYAIRPQPEPTSEPAPVDETAFAAPDEAAPPALADEPSAAPTLGSAEPAVPAAEPEQPSALSYEQDAPQGTDGALINEGTTPEAAPAEAPAPEASDAAAAAGVPDAPGAGDVQAAGVSLSKNPPKIDTSAKPVQETAKNEQVESPARQKAIDRISKGTAYFGTQEKAADFIKKGAIKDTHEVVKTKAGRFEVRAKAAPAPLANATRPVSERQDRIDSILKHGGRVVNGRLRTGDGLSLMALDNEELAAIPDDKKDTSEAIKQRLEAVYPANNPSKTKPDSPIPPMDIRIGDKVLIDDAAYTVTGSIPGGISADSAEESLGGSATAKSTKFLRGDDAFKAKMAADKAGLNEKKAPMKAPKKETAIDRRNRLIAEREAVAAQPAAPAPAPAPDAVVNVPPDVSEAIEGQLRKQKARIARLKREAEADGMSLDEKKRAQTKVLAAETTLRKMRTSIFGAEDAAIKALASGNPADFAAHADIFSDAADVIQAKAAKPDGDGQQDENDAEMLAYESGLNANTRAADRERVAGAEDIAAKWDSMSYSERKAVAEAAGLNESLVSQVSGRKWGGIGSPRIRIEKAMQQQVQQSPAPAQPSTKDLMEAAKRQGKLSVTVVGDKPNGYTSVGKNEDGKDLVQDVRGVRSYVENGIRISEPVAMRPGSTGVAVSIENRRDEFKTVEELGQTTPRAEPTANTIFTEDAAAAARARLKAKLGRLNSGLDPEMMMDGITLAGYHIEKGARTFAAYARAMVADLGDGVKPYLKSWYMGVKYDPRAGAFAGMDGAAAVEAADIDNLSDKAETGAKEDGNATRKLDSPSTGALEGVPSGDVRPTDQGRNAGESADRGGRGDGELDAGADDAGVQGARGAGDGAGGAPVSTGGGRGKRGGSAKRGVSRSGRADEGMGLFGVAGGLTPDVNPAPNAPQIAAPQPTDFTITDELALGEGGQKTKFKNNVAAIRLLNELESTGRLATPDEQAVLAKYVGWGGLPQAFDPENTSWAKEHAEIKALMSPDDLAAAARSTRYAHYTSKEIIQDGIYAALRQFGFTGGKTLEAGAGVGNFIGLMPADMRSAGRFTAIEREPFSSAIARQLYPQQGVQRADFTEFKGNDGYFDAAVGNPPFASDPQTDRSGRKHLSGLSLHNYFFAKSIDMLREGGIMAQVVTNSFLDAKGDKARKYISDRVEFLGAIRLPNSAFSKNAGTEVTTDIIFLKKRPDAEVGGKAAQADAKRWLDTGTYTDKNGKAVALNQYFIDNPNMMLGDFGAFGTMYGPDNTALVARPGQDTLAMLKEAVGRLPKGVYRSIAQTNTMVNAAVVALKNPTVKEGGYFMEGDKLMQRLPDIAGEARGVEITPATQWTAKTTLGESGYERIKALSAMRATVRGLIAAEMSDDASSMKALRVTLNEQYDAYRDTHGLINDSSTLRVFDDDPDYPLLASLEHGYTPGIGPAAAKQQGIKPTKSTAKKGPIFSQRVVAVRQAVQKVDTPADALAVSMAERGRLDAAYIGELLGMDPEQVLNELSTGEKPLLFRDPATDEYVLRDAYLSGNVRAKLAQARQAGMFANVTALEAVQPEDVGSHEITARLGSPWVPASIYQEFAKVLYGEEAKVKVLYVPTDSSFVLSVRGASEVALSNTWGTSAYAGDALLQAVMNNRSIKVTYVDSDKKTRTDVDATEKANEKASEIKAKFNDWLFADAERSEILTKAYNETNNNYVTRVYDGSSMTFPGKVPDSVIKFRRHQRNAIARIVQDRTALLDHVVGAGKTFTVIAGAMELKRTGLARKPMVAVPNHLVKQWAADFYRLYPGANVLTATKKDFEKANRRKFLAKIATGDWDAVVIAHSSYGFIKPAPEFEANFNQREIAKIMETIKAVEASDDEKQTTKRTVKQLEGMKERLENRIKALRDKPMDDLLDFEQIGVDQLFVDEAHMFKNLMYSTKMQGVAGLNDPTGSQRAYDMYVKTNQVMEKNGRGQGVVFATGTPVSNSLAEMYHMMRYLMPAQMKEMGFESFDAWANTYAAIEQVWMQKVSADGFKAQTRMGTFVNTTELLKLFDQVSDTVTMDDIKKAYAEENKGAEFPLPKLKGGRRTPVSMDKSPAQDAYMEEIAERAKTLEQRKGPPKKGEDNILVIMSDARKAAMDIRLVDPNITAREKGGRIDRSTDEVVARYKQYDKVKGTQIVFSDLGTPLKSAKKELKEYEALQARIQTGNADVATSAALGNEAAIETMEDAEAAQAELDAMGSDWLSAVQSAIRGFSIYDDFKAALIEKGIPEAEIAFIHDYNTDDQKASLFRKVNAGQIRVLLGSTAKLGAGTNVQERLVAEHHLDVPWRPSDVEQREGRIERQGNRLMTEVPNFEIEILAYVTRDTLDMRMWQVQETKLKMINQLRTRKIGREIDNAFEDMELSAGEMQAAATGDINLLKEIQLRNDVKKLEQRRRAFDGQRNDLLSRKRRNAEMLKTLPAALEAAAEEAKFAAQYQSDRFENRPPFKMNIDGVDYTDAKEAQEILRAKDEATEEVKALNGEVTPKKAPLSVTIDGELIKNRATMAELFSSARGDVDPVAWTFNGETYRRRTVLANAIRQRVVDAIADESIQQIGKIGAYDVAVEGSAGKGGEVLIEATMSRGGRVVLSNSMTVADSGAAPGRVVTMVENLLTSAVQKADHLERTLVRAKKDAADLAKTEDAGAWPDQGKLDAAREAHKAVLGLLKKKDAPAGDEGDGEAVAFSRADLKAAKAAHARISQNGVTSPDDLRDMLRVPGYSQWAQSTIVGDVGATKALRAELEKAFPGFDWKAPKLNDQGVITLYPDWEGASVDSIKRLTALADRYDVPVAVRGGAGVSPRLFEAAGFVPYNGMTETAGRLPETLFSLIRPAGGITDTTPLFSFAGNAPAARPPKGLPTSTVTQIVDAIKARWANAPEIVVVADMNDTAIPKAVREADAKQRSQGATGEPEGFFYKGKVYVVAGALNKPADVVRVLFHETLGHAGLRGVFGESLTPILKQIAALRKTEVAAKAKEYGLDMNKEADRLQAAEEVLAVMAQTQPELGYVKRAIAAIRGWLRRHVPGFGKMVLTDADIIQQYLLPARGWVERGAGGAGGDVSFLRAFHGSPHRAIEKFSTDKIGTGEGAQAYGWGLYFASKKEVAEYYRRSVSRGAAYAALDGENIGSGEYGTWPQRFGISEAVARRLNDWIVRLESGKAVIEDAPAYLRDRLSVKVKGQLYEVEIPEDSEMLLWDKPLSEQPEGVRKALEKLDWIVPSVFAAYTGQQLYEGQVRDGVMFDGKMRGDARRDTSLALMAAGIKGIKYLDGTSRNAGDGSYNYVVFSGDDVAIQSTMFSRSSPIGIQQTLVDAVPQGVIDRLSDMTTSQRGFNRWWHRTVGTQLHKAKTNKQFAPVYYAVQDFMKDVSHMATLAADQAPDLLPQVDSLGDVKKLLPQMGIAGNRKRKAQMKEASDALFDGTLRYTRDASGKAVLAQEEDAKGIVWTTEELKARGMSAESIQLYRQARKAINQSLDNLLAADVYRMATALNPETLAATRPDYEALLDRVRKSAASDNPGAAVNDVLESMKTQRDVVRARIKSLKTGGNGRLDAAVADELKRQSGELENMDSLIEAVEGKVDRIKDLKASGYAPLMRFGQYTLDALDAGGNRVFFGMYESQMAANEAARKFRADGLTVRQGVQSQKEFELLKGVSPETAMLFADMMGMEKNDAMQSWLQNAVAQQSALKRHIRRKGVEGFDNDASRVVAAFLTSNSRAASRALHGMRIQERVENVRDGDVKDEAIALAEYVNNPKEEAQALRSLLFINYIGGSVASALVNLTQTVVQTLPYLSQYGGPMKAGKRIAGAVKLATGKIEDAELKAAVERAEREGVIKPQEVFQLQAEASRTMGSDIRVRAGLAVWGSFFQMAEVFNRRVAFMAAYQTAKDQGVKDAYAFAENAVDETQGTFNKGNRPNWARGAVGATLFTFKTFTIQYVEFLKRLPPKERALALGVLILLSGIRGLPFAEDAEDIVDTVAQQLGYNFTTKEQMDRFLVSTLGSDFADFLQHGASTLPGVPFDVSARLGMANLLPGTSIAKPSETNKQTEALEVFGVAGSFVGDIIRGEVRPIAIRNLAKGLDMYDRGIYTDARGRKVMDVSPMDAVMKGIGLQPNDVAAESRAVRTQYEKRALFTTVKNDISEQLALGMFENNQGKVKAAREKLDDWNEKNPEARIVINTQAIRRRVVEMRRDRSDRFVRSAPKEMKAGARAALE